MRKSLITFALVFVLIASCDEDPPLSLRVPCVLVKQELSNGLVNAITYNDQLAETTTATSPGGSVTGTFVYNSGGYLEQITYPGGAREVLTYIDGNITRLEKYEADNSLVSRTDFDYVYRQITRIQFYTNNGSTPGDYHTIEYQGTSPDPVRKSIFHGAAGTVPALVQEFTYEGYNSPLSASSGRLRIYFRLGGLAVEKAISRIAGNNGEVIDYTYEYNTQRYPTKSIETHSNGQVIITEYTYDCD